MIQGKQRTQKEYTNNLTIGVGEVEVVAVNPDKQELMELLKVTDENIDKFKDPEYLGTKDIDGEEVKTLRLDFYVKNKETEKVDKIAFFLQNKERTNKTGDKNQFIDNVGTTSWAVDENSLPDWFTKRDTRKAKVGEEELYKFLRSWISGLDYKDAATELQLDWSKLMKGNTREIREQIGGEFASTVLVSYYVRNVTTTNDSGKEEVKQYQGISNKFFLPGWQIKFFKNTTWDIAKLENLRSKKTKELKPFERFAVDVTDVEHGIRDTFQLAYQTEYDSSVDLAATNKVISTDGDDY